MSEVVLNRLVPIWDCLAKSAQGDGCANSEDVESFRTRARSEGLPYLTDGLAGIGRVALASIRRGYVTKEELAEVRLKPKVGSTLPLFLYSCWSRIFTDEGLLRGGHFDDHDGVPTLTSCTPPVDAAVAVMWLRQLTVVFSKMQLPHNDDTVDRVAQRFVENERDMAAISGRLWRTRYAEETTFPYLGEGQQRLTDVLLRARRLLHRLLCNSDPRDILPRHGSGASANRVPPWDRYDRILFDPAINAIWPYLEYACSGKEHCSQILSADFITMGYPKIARGVFVPKDYRGPRFISCEPSSSMYYQQGVMTKLVNVAETDDQTSGFVNFTDQSINQTLAKKASIDRKDATLDLKDASDRLHMDLVVLLWPDHWYHALSAVRSKVTEIVTPQGTIKVPLRKHAPMGSATCFPVMALTLWALIKAAQFTTRKTRVYVYGDDIIVASRDAEQVCRLIDAVGLKVNRDKSFSGATPFRESCGKEYWSGFDVTPVYCRYNPCDNDSVSASLCSFVNNLTLTRGLFIHRDMVQLIHSMTGAPVIGRDEITCRQELSCEAELPPALQDEWDILSRQKHKSKILPLMIWGCHYQCMKHTLKSRRAMGLTNPGDKIQYNFQKKLYRLRRPYPVRLGIRTTTWGYVLRSSLIGGDLGFADAAAVPNRVVYKYGWVALDW